MQPHGAAQLLAARRVSPRQALRRLPPAVEPLVYKNDAIDLAGVQALLSSGQVQSIVISPGPGSPERASDIGTAGTAQPHCRHVPR